MLGRSDDYNSLRDSRTGTWRAPGISKGMRTGQDNTTRADDESRTWCRKRARAVLSWSWGDNHSGGNNKGAPGDKKEQKNRTSKGHYKVFGGHFKIFQF